MTSEGQYAGQQPAEATSGGAAEPYGPDGLPPDADGQRLTGRPPAPAARPPYPPGASASYPPGAASPPHPPAAPSASYPPGAASASYPPSATSPPHPPARASASYPPAAASASVPSAPEPNSYGPPPAATPNGGSPFVVPAVSSFSPPPPASTGSARVPGPDQGILPRRGAADDSSGLPRRGAADDSGGLPRRGTPEDSSGFPRRGTPEDSSGFPRRGTPEDSSGLPRRDTADDSGGLPRRTASAPFEPPPGSGAPGAGFGQVEAGRRAESSPSGWAPAPTTASSDDDHPYRGAARQPAPSADIHGFAPGSPTRAAAGSDQSDEFDQPATARPPGLSAFGDQRVRVPGATLTDLPDAPGQPREDSVALPRRTPAAPPFDPPERPSAGRAPFRPEQPDSGRSSFGPDEQPNAGRSPLAPPQQPATSRTPFDPDEQPNAGRSPLAPPQQPATGRAPFGPADQSSAVPPSFPTSTQAGRQPLAPPTSGALQPPAFGTAHPPTSGAPQPFVGRTPGSPPFGTPASGSAQPPAPPTSGAPQPFGARPGRAPVGSSEPFGPRPTEQPPPAPRSAAASFEPDVPGRPFNAFGKPDQRPAGNADNQPPSPLDRLDEPARSPFTGGPAGQGGLAAQRVPGASFGASGTPIAAEPRNGSVPQPRDPGDRAQFGDPGAGGHGSGGHGEPHPAGPSQGEPHPAGPSHGGHGGPSHGGHGELHRSGDGEAHRSGHDTPGRAAPETGDRGWPHAGSHVVDRSVLQSGEQAESDSNGPILEAADHQPGPNARSATGTARPVTGSASVPTPNRAPVTPDELPPPKAAPQARVYGRAAAPDPDDEPAGDQMTRNDRMTSDDRMASGDRITGGDQMTGDERMSGGDRMASGERMAGDGRDDDDRHGAWPWDRPQPSNDAHAPYQRKPEPPATGRATASARVAPPSEAKRTGPPYTEFTTDVAGRGRPEEGDRAAEQQEPYSEHTTDISGRGRADQHPYVPAPALPSMHAAPPLTDGFPSSGQKPPPGIEGDRLRMGGVFPGPPGRATVSPPPGPEQAASWPGAPAGAVEDSRFEQFRPEAEAPAAKPETPHVRTLPVLIGVIIAAALLVGAAFGLVYLISGDSDNAGLQVSVGDCVKKDGEAATTAACTDEGAFQVASIADSQDKCADPQQPYVVDPTSDGRTRVLCLKPVV